MIQEIFPDDFNATYVPGKSLNPGDSVLLYRENKALLKKSNDSFVILKTEDLTPESMRQEMKFIGRLNNNDFYLALSDHTHLHEDEFQELDLFDIRRRIEKPLKWIISVGLQLYKWYNENRYCGKCGGTLRDRETERGLECVNCQTTVYPKISPAIIVAVTKGDEILLAQSVNFKGRFYSILAGFVEVGETFEEAVKREVMEETGIDVKNITYYKSQPWPFSSSIMIGFFAEYDGNKSIKIDPGEIADAKWFLKNNLPLVPDSDSIAGEMIRLVAQAHN